MSSKDSSVAGQIVDGPVLGTLDIEKVDEYAGFCAAADPSVPVPLKKHTEQVLNIVQIGTEAGNPTK